MVVASQRILVLQWAISLVVIFLISLCTAYCWCGSSTRASSYYPRYMDAPSLPLLSPSVRLYFGANVRLSVPDGLNYALLGICSIHRGTL